MSRGVLHHVAKAFGIHLKGDVATNEISTAKYTLLTFLPVNLFEQFLRVANMYFLLMVILQLIPGLSPTSLFTTVAPLVFVLAVNAIKEGYDDVQRHRCAGKGRPAAPGSRSQLMDSRGVAFIHAPQACRTCGTAGLAWSQGKQQCCRDSMRKGVHHPFAACVPHAGMTTRSTTGSCCC